MDNNYDNGFYGGEPQRPFTEKPSEQPQQPPQQNPAFGFNPEKPLMQKPQEPNGAQPNPAQAQPVNQPNNQPNEQGFNPIEHTAMYQDGAFRTNQAQPVQPQMNNNYHPQNNPQGIGAQPPYGAPQNTDFSRQSYYNPAINRPQPMQPMRPAQPVQPAQAPQQAYITPLQSAAVPAQEENMNNNPYNTQPQNPAPYYQPEQPKKKSNKGLVAVIIVLAVLLAASFVGLLIFAFSQSADNRPAPGNNFGENFGQNGDGQPFTIPDFSMPNYEQQQPATEAIVHDESDYSDKVIKDYKGLTLAAKPADADTNKSYGAEYAYEKASPSVVGILGYLDSDKKTKGSEGSGIIISEDGYVITNAHVILNSKTALVLKVVTADNKEYSAGVVGFDSRTDIAVLKLDNASGLTPAAFGNSDSLQLGEDIIIVGNPGGIEFQNSMTKGIVSALDRDASNKSLVKYIQTDAAINPGNSGGPAVNMYGQVVGIATSKIVDEKYEGMGFCIPTASAKTIIDSLMKNGYVEGRVKIGISGVAVTASESATYGIPSGIMVESVDENGPCGKSGIEADDIITEADGQAITSFSDIYNVLENHKAGDKIKIKYSHYESSGSNFNGTYTEKEVEIELAEDKG